MESQLKKYGLSIDIATKLQWSEVTINEPDLPKVRAIRMPYFHPCDMSKEVMGAHGKPFVRYRVLNDQNNMRYIQPKNSGVEAYYPPILPWDLICKDTSLPVIITEGEAKASKGCMEGFPVIGLGGVHNFRSLRKGVTLCKTLEVFNWVGREIVILFDSDIVENIHVVHAMNTLAETLIEHGAIPHASFIPSIDDSKTGLDDFLIARGPEELDLLIEAAIPLGAIKALMELNKKYIVVRDNSSIYSNESDKFISRNNFINVVEAPAKTVKYHVVKGGAIKAEILPAASEWLKWPIRSEVKKIVYEPGFEKIVDNMLNIWPGWGCQPEEGDCHIFKDFLAYLFRGQEDDKRWFLQWLAYPIQNPGTKLFTASVLYSNHHGTGKSFLGQIIGRIYGKNYAEITNRHLEKDFNEWAENKQFILGDEITSSDRRKESDNLKRIITSSELRVNKKYLEEYVIRDCINYLFTTNHPDAFFLEDKDRRFFVHEVIGEPLDDLFYRNLHNWIYNGDGVRKVFWYLLHEVDCSDFNPRSRARDTLGKQAMFENGLSDLATWVRALLVDPEMKLHRNGVKISKDIFSAVELLDLYDPLNTSRVTSAGMGRELARAGIPNVGAGKKFRTEIGTIRLYALKNAVKWRGATDEAIIKEYTTGAPIQKF